jgi:outer membrane protein OmpA-like peptidoglycan-associated protein
MVISDALGIFKIIVPPGSYDVSFAKQGYAVYQASVTLYDKDIKEMNVGLKLPEENVPEPIEEPEFQNILFNPGSAVIKQESYQAMEEVLEFLNAHSSVKMEIQGRTDSIGDDDTNMQLSQLRAEAVQSWLVDRGIEASRLTPRGYGETKPVGDNRTRTGQEANRRIEFVLITD